jgi:putative transposase
MSRKHRIWYPEACYHIICRGNRSQDIFRDEEDRQFYLTTLRQVQKLISYYLHSYCLMTNHVHLQIETTKISISEVMKRINILYSIYFNYKYSFVGHLFQGRYRAELIDTDSYQLEISRYIHLNPVRANMVDFPLDYPWSGYSFYCQGEGHALLKTEKILSYFSFSQVQRYREFVEKSIEGRFN